MIEVIVNNNKSKIEGPQQMLNRLYEDFKIRNPNAYFLRRYMKKGWDGKMPYITEAGYVATGLLPQVFAACKKYNHGIKFVDDRFDGLKYREVKEVGGMKLRKYQREAVASVVENFVGDMYFPRGIIKAATNAGKTLIAAAIYEAFYRKPLVFLVNSSDLFDQLMRELPELLPGEIGCISPKKVEWKNFMVVKVQTARVRMDQYKDKLAKYQIAIVDECDLSDNKTYKSVIMHLFNAYVRVGMSGTALASTLAKHKLKNQNIRCYFGEMVYEISNKDLQEKGHSSQVIATVVKGSDFRGRPGDYDEEYKRGIIKNKSRNRRILRRVKYNCIKKKRLPALVVVQKHKHVKILYKKLVQEFPELRVEWVHHERKERKSIIREFTEGNVDILLSSMIIRRGMNFPLLRYMLNAGGGDSIENLLQLLGRVMRLHPKGGNKYFEDMFDEGHYLKRHSKHRVIYLKKEGIKVKEKY